mmetsp:Transcript_5620/g.15708  ORF Transcript_5620/g.15708 Transcript_5620/m.15708 type:complete len:265 (-) Transcript_5620:173-967(-)
MEHICGLPQDTCTPGGDHKRPRAGSALVGVLLLGKQLVYASHDLGLHDSLLLVPVDLDHDVRVEPLDGRDVLVELDEACAQRRLGVVAALVHARSNLAGGGREELDVVGLARDRVDAAARNALHEDLVRHVQQNEGARVDAQVLEHVRLRHGARHTIEQVALVIRHVLSRGLDDVHDELIRHEVARVHEALRLHAQRRLALHLRAQRVARRDVLHVVALRDGLALRALSRGRGAGDDEAKLLAPTKRQGCCIRDSPRAAAPTPS